MANLRNSVQLIGHLGKDPEMFTTQSGKVKASFSLATSDSYKNQEGETVRETQWHNLVAWGNVASIAEKYLHKGQEIAVEGKLTSRTYEDKQGQKRTIHEVLVNEVLMLDRKK